MRSIVKKKYIYDLPNFLFINFKDSRSTDEKREVTINKELDMKYDKMRMRLNKYVSHLSFITLNQF